MNNRDKNIIGQILAKTYRIERFLGAGTVGTVYVARHVRSGGLYAVKVLHRKLAASPDLYQRFQDEARLIATLRHPHILPITDFDRDENGIPFFVMDLLEGENLQQRLKHKEVLPSAQALEIIQQVGSALQTAHRSGIVHRNIKPENVFLVRHDLGDRVIESTRIMDFGLARFRRMAPAGTRDASLGVSCYMAPETLSETTTPIDGRADQWAMAVIAYRMLSGKLPWDEGNPEELLRQIVNEAPRPLPRTAELPAHTVAAISRGMSKRREDRYETMMDFVRALTARTASAAHVETGGTPPATPADAAPQHRPPVPSGRVAAPAPPIPSGAVTGPPPPPVPPAPASAPPPPVPGAVPVAPVTAKPAAAPPPQSAPPPVSRPASGPPPVLAAPPLLIPEGTAAAAPEPSRRPTLGLAIAGGALAILAGICITLLWEHRQRPRPLTNPPTLNTTATGPASSLVVEPLGPPPTTPVEDAGPRGPAMPQVPIPPIRSATGEDVTQAPAAAGAPTAAPSGLGEAAKTLSPPTPPAAPGVVNPPVPAASPTPSAAPTGPAAAAPGTAVRPGTPPSPSPAPSPGVTPTAAPPAAMAPGPVGQAPAPVAAPPVAAPAANPGPRSASRDEVDELLGSGGRPAAAAPQAPPVAAAPAPSPRPAPPQRPAARTTGDGEGGGDSADKTPEQLLEDAQAAYVRGERQRSIDLALQVTARGGPTEVTKAWRFIGSAACSIRSSTLASRAYTSLSSPEHKQLLAELCKRNGLSLQDGQFVTE